MTFTITLNSQLIGRGAVLRPCFLSPGLLQLSVLRHLGRTDEPVVVVQNAAARLVTDTRRSDYTLVFR